MTYHGAAEETVLYHSELQQLLTSANPEAIPTADGMRAAFEDFITNEYIPAMCAERSVTILLYEKLKKMHVVARQHVVIPGSAWHVKNMTTLRTFATISSLCFLTMAKLHSSQHSIKLLAPMLLPCWTEAIYYGAPLAPALRTLLDQVLYCCWTYGDDQQPLGIQYLMVHVWDEDGEYYPCSRLRTTPVMPLPRRRRGASSKTSHRTCIPG